MRVHEFNLALSKKYRVECNLMLTFFLISGVTATILKFENHKDYNNCWLIEKIFDHKKISYEIRK